MNAALLSLAALVTAFISGVFGMAGGLVFMGVVASVLSVPAAMVTHGIVQSVSNGSRAWLLRGDIQWGVFARIVIGAGPAIVLLALITFVPSKAALFLALGLLPVLLWVPRRWVQLDAGRPRDAYLCGAAVAGLNLSAGVAGPAMDLFFVRTAMTRQQIVATKAVTMFAAHLIKIAYFGVPLVRATGLADLPAPPAFALALPLAVLGTWGGTRVLARFSDVGFRRYTRLLVSVIGVVYVWRAVSI